MKNSVKILLTVFFIFISQKAAWPESLNQKPLNPVKTITIDNFKQMIYAVDSRYMVVFTASWCGPCKEELPSLVKLNKEYKNHGLRMIGLSLDYEGIESMQPVVDKYNVDFPVFWGGEAAIEAFNISSIPLLFLVKDGKIVEKIPGNLKFEFLKKKITAFLK